MMQDNNGQEANADAIQQASQQQPVNEELVKALRLILAEAEKGSIQGMAFIRVVRPGSFNVFTIGSYLMEYHAGAHLLMDGCKDYWKAQLQAAIDQATQRGLQKATMADLNRLPNGFGRRRPG